MTGVMTLCQRFHWLQKILSLHNVLWLLQKVAKVFTLFRAWMGRIVTDSNNNLNTPTINANLWIGYILEKTSQTARRAGWEQGVLA